jgi:hypothetical protein
MIMVRRLPLKVLDAYSTTDGGSGIFLFNELGNERFINIK